MGKSGVKVVIRTRPTATFAQNQIQIDQDESTITIHNHQDAVGNGPSNHKDVWKFRYHQVLHNAGQDTVYDAIAQDIVHAAVIDGINGTILAYGQTGAGKTFTMIGDTKNYPYRGIAPRAVAQVFHQVHERIEVSYDVAVSYMEIYNDRIFDLLSTGGHEPEPQEFVIVEDAKGTSVRGLAKIPVDSEKEALDQLFNGELQRTIAEHKLNKRSNRSHCIFTFHIAQRSRTGGSERVIHSKLHLVDLAGSERLKKTMMADDSSTTSRAKDESTMRKESMYINQSLTYLEQCIVALGAKTTRHIPYRQTKLTNVLKDSLGGNCNTLMFACVWAESKHLEETTATLKLAQRMMKVTNDTTSIVETNPLLLLKKYERQIKELKQELTMHDALAERSTSDRVYDEFTPEQIHGLMSMVRSYVDTASPDDEQVLELTSVHQIQELFRQFKILVVNAEQYDKTQQLLRPVSSAQDKTGATKSATTTPVDEDHHSQSSRDPEYVGEIETSGGMPVGQASDMARPVSMETSYRPSRPESPQAKPKQDTGDNDRDHEDHHERDQGQDLGFEFEFEAEGKPLQYPTTLDYKHSHDNKSDAFVYFQTQGRGQELSTRLRQVKTAVRECRQEYRQKSCEVNALKKRIDVLKGQLEEKKSNRVMMNDQERRHLGTTDEIVDEEEFLLMKEERQVKRDYRQVFEGFRNVKTELECNSERLGVLKQELVDAFEIWFEQLEGRTSNPRSKDGEALERLDKMDDGEKFDKLEMDRIVAEDPASLAFFQAQKKMRQQVHGPTPVRRSKRG